MNEIESQMSQMNGYLGAGGGGGRYFVKTWYRLYLEPISDFIQKVLKGFTVFFIFYRGEVGGRYQLATS